MFFLQINRQSNILCYYSTAKLAEAKFLCCIQEKTNQFITLLNNSRTFLLFI